MQFSPYFLLRKPTYNLSHVDEFSLDTISEDINDENIEEKRQYFLSLIKSEDLLLSLLFSSKTLYQALPHYEFHASVKIRKKERQTERAVSKYLFRMALNPSPLAAFAGSQFVNWKNEIIPAKSKYFLSLSLAQRKEFFDLCYCDVELQSIMRYRLNPSLRKTDDGFTYLNEDNGELNRVNLEQDPDFEFMFNLLNQEDFTFSEFVEKSDYDVNDFLESQLITPSYPVYSNTKILEDILTSIITRFKIKFTIEEFVGRGYNALDDKMVINIQDDWMQKLSAYAKKLEVALNDSKVYSERVFYLNSYSLKNKVPNFDREKIAKETVKLVQLVERLTEKSEEHSLSLESLLENPISEQPTYSLEHLRLGKTDQGNLILDLEAQGTKLTTQDIGIMLRHSGSDKPKLVNVTTAHGKFFAPILDAVENEVNNEIESWVLKSSSDLVMLKDESIHSKNKSHSFVKEMDNYGLDFYTPIKDRVRLDIDKSGQLKDLDTEAPVRTINLGMQQVSERSNTYQNLYSISEQLPNIPEFIDAVQKAHTFVLKNSIQCLPRLESKQILLGYKKWIINDKQALPVFDNVLVDSVKKLNTWRNQIGIPRLVSYCIDGKRANFHDFVNPWSVDNFVRALKLMESNCVFVELGLPEEIKGVEICESYFEINLQSEV